MMSLEEKKIYGGEANTETSVGPAHAHGDTSGRGLGHGQHDGLDYSDYYDPMLESRMTRLGLNFESFKRAPGSTR